MGCDVYGFRRREGRPKGENYYRPSPWTDYVDYIRAHNPEIAALLCRFRQSDMEAVHERPKRIQAISRCHPRFWNTGGGMEKPDALVLSRWILAETSPSNIRKQFRTKVLRSREIMFDLDEEARDPSEWADTPPMDPYTFQSFGQWLAQSGGFFFSA